MDKDIIIFILGSLFGLGIFYITQYFVWDRSNRDLLLGKYERAYSFLMNENTNLINRSSDLLNMNTTVLRDDHDALRMQKLTNFKESYMQFWDLLWTIHILPAYDKDLTFIVKRFLDARVAFTNSALDIVEELSQYHQINDKEFKELENEYRDISITLMSLLAEKTSIRFENPFAKQIPKF